jgi:hypothetical protein
MEHCMTETWGHVGFFIGLADGYLLAYLIYRHRHPGR